jgi:hypothetical protein
MKTSDAKHSENVAHLLMMIYALILYGAIGYIVWRLLASVIAKLALP